MQFLFQPLTLAFLLVLLPLLIHLINLMRQRKVEWAAMEFLLASHKKHRRWVWLRQFILLSLRMLVVATVVAMLAGLVSPDQASFLSGQATHHYILLDDSLSMADQSSSGRAFDRAMQALTRIADRLANQPSGQKVTLLRFSQTTLQPSQGTSAADMNAETVDSGFVATMEAQKRRFDVTELAALPGPTLELASQLIGNAAERQRVVYLLSDFRADTWDASSELKEGLRSLRKLDADVHLIHCSSQQHQNLSIRQIVPEAGTLAAGVPLLVNVHVQNHGPAAAQQVAIRVAAKSYPEDVFVRVDQDVAEEQVTMLVIDEIPAHESAVRQAQLKFDRAGQHLVEATLAGDAVSADNTRRCLIDIPAGVPVLIVDGSGQNEEAFYLESIFSPGRVVTGINPVSRPVTFLRDVTDDELARFAAIYLLNVESMDEKGIRALERYVDHGGGLAVFAGDNVDPAFLNDWYDDGEGLFPIPVRGPRDHVRGDPDVPDLQAIDHPIFRVLIDEGGKNRPLARRIRIRQYLGIDPDVQLEDLPQAKVLATLPTGDPVVVGRSFGSGEVVAFLTTASPAWNNWAMGPSYPVVILQLHGFLSSNQTSPQAATVGEPIRFQLDTTTFQPSVEFIVPAGSLMQEQSAAATIKKTAEAAPSDSPLHTFSLGVTGDMRNGETDRSGVYVAQLRTLDGQPRQRRFVANPPNTESDLAKLATSELSTQFEDLGVEVHDVEEMKYEGASDDGFSWGMLLAGLLVVLLLGEQLFAYSASYHPSGGNER